MMRNVGLWRVPGLGMLALLYSAGACQEESVSPGPAKVCVEACKQDADCDAEPVPGIPHWECRDGMCVRVDCANSADCLMALSGCADSDDCDGASQTCVQWSFSSGCYPLAGNGGSCAWPGETAVYAEDVAGNAVSVCADTTGVSCLPSASGDVLCHHDVPCADDSFCYGSTPSCDAASGACQCAGDSCDGQESGDRCMADGTCGCEQDSDCSGVHGAVACHDGVCGCREHADCKGYGLDTCYAGTCGCKDEQSCDGVAKTHHKTSWACRSHGG